MSTDVELAYKLIKTIMDEMKKNIKPEKINNNNTSASTWKKLYSTRDKLEEGYDKLFKALKQAETALDVMSEEIVTYKEDKVNLEEGVNDLKLELANSVSDQVVPKEKIRQSIEEYLPKIISDTVKETLANDKVVQSYAKALKDTQKEVVSKAKSTLDNTLEEALVRNQQIIIDSTKRKRDAEEYERKNRARNVAITGLTELVSDNSKQRIEHDINLIANTCNIPKSQIVKCFRAGRIPEKQNENENANVRPRPLIAILISPEEAQKHHKYGFGTKISNSIWINKDMTRSERQAAFNARQARRNYGGRRSDAEQSNNVERQQDQ